MASSVGSKTELLTVLGDVKAKIHEKLGNVDFPIPQFILIGKQSVGKSRLIEALAGEVFNFTSGTLGSRRPTMLEMQHTNQKESKWYVRNPGGAWEQKSVNEVMKIVGNAHESLGMSVSADPVYVRIESPNCVDVSMVDLPGFRDFSLNEEAKALAGQIENLVKDFMKDPKNVMLCVEQAGDAATMSTLARCKEVDPKFDRTILVRNKLDKYYKDLTSDNVQPWCKGFGDMPEHLMRFSLTLPFWSEGNEPPSDFANLTSVKAEEDKSHLSGLGLDEAGLKTIGFNNFAAFVQVKIQDLFVKAIDPVLKELKRMEDQYSGEAKQLAEEYTDTDPMRVVRTTQDCGRSFAVAVREVMEGLNSSKAGRKTLEQDLQSFYDYHTAAMDGLHMLPAEEFFDLEDYTNYLLNEVGLHNTPCLGGAQWRRILQEVEIFLRFSEIAVETKKRDVIQARGVAMSELTWRDCVVKLMGNEAHVPLERRLRYVAERLKWYFFSHKDIVVDYMCNKNALHSANTEMNKHGKMIRSNEMVRLLVYSAYDTSIDRQMKSFLSLFGNMLTSTFSNPWVFLKGASANSMTDGTIPPGCETKERIPLEIESRSGIDTMLTKWLQAIPTETHQIDEAVDKVQQLVLKTYSFIRSQVCDQVELFAESFFKVPMLRRLEEDMKDLELTEQDQKKYADRRNKIQSKKEAADDHLGAAKWCVERLRGFQLKQQARKR